MKDRAKEFRKQWSHQPTPIPPDATGLWYSEECTDELMVAFAKEQSRICHCGARMADHATDNHTPTEMVPVPLESAAREIAELQEIAEKWAVDTDREIDPHAFAVFGKFLLERHLHSAAQPGVAELCDGCRGKRCLCGQSDIADCLRKHQEGSCDQHNEQPIPPVAAQPEPGK